MSLGLSGRSCSFRVIPTFLPFPLSGRSKFQLSFRSGCSPQPFRSLQINEIKKGTCTEQFAPHCLLFQKSCIHFAVVSEKQKYIEAVIYRRKDDGKIKITLDPRRMSNVCHLLDPPHFSLDTNFNFTLSI